MTIEQRISRLEATIPNDVGFNRKEFWLFGDTITQMLVENDEFYKEYTSILFQIMDMEGFLISESWAQKVSGDKNLRMRMDHLVKLAEVEFVHYGVDPKLASLLYIYLEPL